LGGIALNEHHRQNKERYKFCENVCIYYENKRTMEVSRKWSLKFTFL